MDQNQNARNAFFIGGGIASLAGAVYLVRDAKMPGKNIIVFDENPTMGGCLDASGSPDKGYVMRGGRMFENQFVCTYDLLETTSSYNDPQKTITQDTFEFFKESSWDAATRLVNKKGDSIDVSTMGCKTRDRLELIRLILTPEMFLYKKRINDWFKPSFFRSNFWLMWSTMFAFQPWHSLVEMRRYMRRFQHHFPTLATMKNISHTRFAQYFSIVQPLMAWLSERGVRFFSNARVTDIEFQQDPNHHTAKRICYEIDQSPKEILITPQDLVFFTNGSMTANASLGSMTSAPQLQSGKPSGAWDLWKRIAKNRTGFGNPEVFCSDIGLTKWESFTITSRHSDFGKAVESFTKRPLGRSGLITFKDSSWLLSLYFHYNPIMPDQPKDVLMVWGYGLNPEGKGDFVKKEMSRCTGAEILAESLHHLKLIEMLPEVQKNSICIPTMMPYITAHFMPREKGDRPLVVPENSENFAFLGQYCEMPDDVVFTVEYSVRSARTAVAHFFPETGPVPGIYKGYHKPSVMLRALNVLFK